MCGRPQQASCLLGGQFLVTTRSLLRADLIKIGKPPLTPLSLQKVPGLILVVCTNLAFSLGGFCGVSAKVPTLCPTLPFASPPLRYSGLVSSIASMARSRLAT